MDDEEEKVKGEGKEHKDKERYVKDERIRRGIRRNRQKKRRERKAQEQQENYNLLRLHFCNVQKSIFPKRIDHFLLTFV
jgi:hypothetical protein